MANDMTIIFGIILLFVAIGVISPYINAEFGSDMIENGDVLDADDSVNGTDVMLSVAGMFFWTFGTIPAWLDGLLFVPLRILLYLIIARNIWIGGGA